MIRSTLAAAVLGTALLAGCASFDSGDTEVSELAERVREALEADPELLGSRVTVTERDGTIVLGGFAESLEEIEAVRAAAEGVDGVTEVENDVVVGTGS